MTFAGSSRNFVIVGVAALAALASACGPSAPLCGTTGANACLTLAGTWTFNTTTTTTNGNCPWENANGTMTITQTTSPSASSSVSVTVPVTLIAGVATLMGNLSATGSLYDNGSYSAFIPQAAVNISQGSLTKSENFQIQFTSSSAVSDAGTATGGSFTGTWGTSETLTPPAMNGTTSQPTSCTRTANINGTFTM